MTLVFKTGETKMLGGMLIRPLPEDLKQFFERLRSLHPGLVGETPAASPIAPGLDDLPFKMTQL